MATARGGMRVSQGLNWDPWVHIRGTMVVRRWRGLNGRRGGRGTEKQACGGARVARCAMSSYGGAGVGYQKRKGKENSAYGPT